MTSQPRPPFDPELEAVLPVLDGLVPKNVTLDDVDTFRALTTSPPIEETIAGRPILHTVRTIPGPVGAPDLTVSVFERTDHTRPGPGIFHTHGGGLIGGDRFVGAGVYLDWVERFDAVVVSVEYRRPPEHPDPAPIEDVYAGLVWTADHAAELRVDPARIVIAGESAGAGLTAGLALLARDRKGPDVLGQVLMYPLLDERNDTVSSHQDDSAGTWDRTSTETAWDAYLGARRGTGGASIYASPSLATDLSHLHPRSSTSDPRNSSAMRTSPSRRPSGPPADRPSCTSGRAASTGSTRSSRRLRSPERPRPHGPAGWSGSSGRDEEWTGGAWRHRHAPPVRRAAAQTLAASPAMRRDRCSSASALVDPGTAW